MITIKWVYADFEGLVKNVGYKPM